LPFGPFATADLQWRLVARGADRRQRRLAGAEAVLLGFDWVVRSFAERLERLRLLQEHTGQAPTWLAPLSLHEAVPENWHMFARLPSEKYEDFARAVRRSAAH
jgi:hypothetical protein